MSFNGSGTFVRLYSWVADAAANIKIRADRMDAETDGIATGLSTCITKNGQTTITADLPMATFKHTGVGNGTARTHYTAIGQTQDGTINWVAAGGTADAITATYTIPITALIDGQLCFVRATAANATATPTFAPSAITAHTITKEGGAALVANNISGAGHELVLRYNLANTRWELLNPKDILGTIATQAANNVAITGGSITGITDLVVADGGTGSSSQTAYAVLCGGTTATAAFQSVASVGTSGQVLTSNGAAALPSFQALPADAKYTSSDQTITSSGSLTLTHGLGGIPDQVQYFLVCQTGEGGYTAGDIVAVDMDNSSLGTNNYSNCIVSATQIIVQFATDGNAFYVVKKSATAGDAFATTNANWKLRVKAKKWA